MLANWVVIVAAFGYIGLLFAIASYGDRVSGQPRGRAGVLIYPLSLAIYCTSWTFFGSVGLATRTGIEFLAIYAGPILMVGLRHAAVDARGAPRQDPQHHLDRRLHRRALRQEPGGGGDRRHHRADRLGPLHRPAAEGGRVVAGDGAWAATAGARCSR